MKKFLFYGLFLIPQILWSLDLKFIEISQTDGEKIFYGVSDLIIGKAGLMPDKTHQAMMWRSVIPEGFITKIQDIEFNINGKKQFVSTTMCHLPNQPALLKEIWAEYFQNSTGFWSGLGDYVHKGLNSGEFFGDYLGRWDSEEFGPYGSNEPVNEPFYTPRRQYIIGYYHEDIGITVETTKDHANLNPMAENVTKVLYRKRNLAVAFEKIGSNLTGLIEQKGILKSLQAKLDSFKKAMDNSQYKTALNIINAFNQELNAQRGKHIPEPVYQNLKTLYDTIVTSINYLVN